jgi:hypothetical protein
MKQRRIVLQLAVLIFTVAVLGRGTTRAADPSAPPTAEQSRHPPPARVVDLKTSITRAAQQN